MLHPWRLEQGPRYAESLKAARRAAGERFDENLSELRKRVRIHPAEATPFMDENRRVLQLVDAPHEYALAIYCVLEPQKRICRIEWVEAGPIEPDFDPWD